MQSEPASELQTLCREAMSTLLCVLNEAAQRIESRQRSDQSYELSRTDLSTLAQLCRVVSMHEREAQRALKHSASPSPAQQPTKALKPTKPTDQAKADHLNTSNRPHQQEPALAGLKQAVLRVASGKDTTASVGSGKISTANDAKPLPFRHELSRSQRAALRKAEKKAKRSTVNA